MMKKLIVSAFALFIAVAVSAQPSKKVMKKLIDENMQFAAQQYKLLMKNTPDTVMPRSYNAEKQQLITSNTKWWCSGFYPGTLWMIYDETKDLAIRTEALKRLALLEPTKNYTGNHDLGFMMYCSFGTAYAITKEPAYKDVIFTAASSLSTRYRPSIKAIQSWNTSEKFKCPVIIDNMMNLELLEWVTQNGGDKKFHEIAVNHANTTMKNQFRPDFSSWHVIDYDLQKGEVYKKLTHQGYSDESAWARGQVWGLYGYIVMYRFTKDPAYLSLARNIAKFVLKHPNLPADKVPYWDFNAPDIPNAKRDVSSASVLASALLELSLYTNGRESKDYVSTAGDILQVLSTPAYRAKAGTNGGFILEHSVGHLPGKSEIDVPLTYADYYFIEALQRYKKWAL
ncbi:glucuronyl hydrolase [Flavitalea antarctica]